MYKGCARYLVMTHVRDVYMLQPLVRPHLGYAHLGLHIAISLKGRTTRIWSFGCFFACAAAMGCSGFRLSLGTILVS